ncbi:MAG: hypothetical protein ABW019_02420 [Chitinophagaceae bacterium]
MKTTERKTTRGRAFRSRLEQGKKYLRSLKADVLDVLDTDEDRVMKYYNIYNFAQPGQRQRAILR